MTKSFASREWLPAASPRGEPVAAYYESEKNLMKWVDGSVRLGPPKSSACGRQAPVIIGKNFNRGCLARIL